MQILKEEIKEKIITVSKEEFLLSGFKGMSIRKVAEKTNISPSNIYNYFSGKDEIFHTIVKNAVTHIDFIINESEEKECRSFDTPEDIEWHIDFISLIYKLISVYRDELKLLFVLSDGSQYEGFKDKIAKKYLAKLDNCGDFQISPFFMYNFTMFYLSYLENIVKENITAEDSKHLLVDLAIYSYNGFNALTGDNKELFDKIIEKIK